MKKIFVFTAVIAMAALSFGAGGLLLATNNDNETIAAVGNYSTDSSTYYSGITETSGTALLGQLHDLLVTTHQTFTVYDDCSNPVYIYATDGNPSDSSYDYEFYSQANIGYDWGAGAQGTWNREHVWCQSLSTDGVSTTQLWGTTGAGADLHHLRPVESGLNSARNNSPYGIVALHDSTTEKYYEDSTDTPVALGGWKADDTFEPLDAVKGDVARILMYVYTHYNTYANVGGTTDGSATYSAYYGTIPITNIVNTSEGTEAAAWSMLLSWNESDPVDARETRRNEAAATYQGDRNPFIDNSTYASAIWGGGEANTISLSVTPSTLTLSSGETSTLTATMSDSSTPTITWSTSNSSIATVSSSGLVTAVADGSAIITATATDGENVYTDTCAVTVSTVATGDYALVTSINDVTSGNYVIAANASGTYYPLSTFASTIASSTGITVTNNTIANADALSYVVSLTISGTSVNIYDGTNYLIDADSTSFSTSSTEPSTPAWTLSTGTNGTFRLTGSTYTTRGVIYRLGTYYVYKCYDVSGATSGSTTYFDLELFKEATSGSTPAVSLSVDPSTLSLSSGETSTLTATMSDSSTPTITWTTSNSSIATVSSSGVVTAVADGSATITATATDGENVYTDTCAVTVSTASQSGTSITINEAYGGGGNTDATYKQDFVELYNNTDTYIALSGYYIFYASATGSFTTSTALSGTILPRSYFLVQEAAGSAGTVDVPTADVTGTIAMSATAFKLALTNSSTAPTTATDANVIDFVGAGTTASLYETAKAPAPSNTNSIARTITSGVSIDTNDNSVDFVAGAPTPCNGAISVADRIMAYESGDIVTAECATKYTTIKTQITSLTSGSLSYFQTNTDNTTIVSARERYAAWATANGDANPYSASQGLQLAFSNYDNNFLLMVVLSITGISTIAGYFLLKKKRFAK